MISVGYAGRTVRAAEPEAVWSDLELPGWEDFTSARDRFFAGLGLVRTEDATAAAEAVDGPGSGPAVEG